MAARVGFYSDWLDGPRREAFHTQELPRILAAEYRAKSRAAVAAVSMGCLGALDCAARHPGQYTAAASFSGIVHTRMSNRPRKRPPRSPLVAPCSGATTL
jgi:diacylglycerol O-acyltransferase/trehalose O-mycolyltransferase